MKRSFQDFFLPAQLASCLPATHVQLSAVELLPSFLAQHPTIRLVVVDSVTFHFRQVQVVGSRCKSRAGWGLFLLDACAVWPAMMQLPPT